MPLISVVIPTYQHALFVGQAIKSVLSQTFNDYEIIIIDDGSTDNTSDVLSVFGDQITVIKQANRGQPASRNMGIAHSSGEFIAFLDADDIWLANKLEKQLETFEHQPDLGLVYADTILFNGENKLGNAFTLLPPKSGWIFNDLFKENFIPMSTVVVRRQCFAQAGLFDEGLHSCEDYDMLLRICRTWKAGFVNEPLAFYRISAGQLSKDEKRTLTALIQLKSKALVAYQELKNLTSRDLDGYYFNYYTRLAKLALKVGQTSECMRNLKNYRQLRGGTPRYWFLRLACLLPVWCNKLMIDVWDYYTQK
jgi:glycosyltransferase involved in cell wall biosynthesis